MVIRAEQCAKFETICSVIIMPGNSQFDPFHQFKIGQERRVERQKVWLASWTRPDEGSCLLDGIFIYCLDKFLNRFTMDILWTRLLKSIWYILSIFDSPGQVKLHVGQVGLSQVFFYTL